MMTKYPLNIMWSEEDGEYMVTCPAFPGLSAFGETEEEALAEAKVALALFIESYQERNIPLPEAQTAQQYSGQIRVRFPKSLHGLAARLAEAQRVSLNQYIVDSVRARASGEQVGMRYLEEIRQLLTEQTAQNQMLVANAAMNAPSSARGMRRTINVGISVTDETGRGETLYGATQGKGQ